MHRLYKGTTVDLSTSLCKAQPHTTPSHSREANDKPTTYDVHPLDLHHNHPDHAHRWAWRLQQRHSWMQVRSGLFGTSLLCNPIRSRYHLRRHRGRIRRLCLRRLDMWPGRALPARLNGHPNNERNQQLRDGEHRAFQRCFARPRWRGPLRARTWL